MGITLIFKNRERRPLGHGAKGKLVPPKDGKMGYFIPSFGALEQKEIDYIVEAQEEKAKKEERITHPRRIQVNTTKKDHEVDIKEV